jgi:AcrR family transcriptional regulator
MVLKNLRESICHPSKLARPRDREASTQKLLDAGVEIFSQFGYDAATTRMVAKRAGVNESLIHRYFESKAGLLLAIILAFIQSEDGGKNQPHPPGQDLEEEIRNFMGFQLEHDLKMQAFMRVAISRALVDAKLSTEIGKSIGKGKMPHLLRRLQDFRASGDIRGDVDLESAGSVIAAQAFSLNFMGCIVFGRSRAETLEEIDLFAKVFARGLRS